MEIQKGHPIPALVIGQLRTKYKTEAEGTTIAIEQGAAETLYITLIMEYKDGIEYKYLSQISKERLQLIASGEMPVIHPFLFPEKEMVYTAGVKSNSIEQLSMLSPPPTREQLPLKGNFKIEFNVGQHRQLEVPDIIELSKARDRIIVDIHLTSDHLNTNLQYWSIKKFLLPFTELVKTALLDKTKAQKNKYEDVFYFGYKNISFGSLHTQLESAFTHHLFDDEINEAETLHYLFHLFLSDDIDSIVKVLDNFRDKKVIPQYIKVLRNIIEKNSQLTTSIATPDEKHEEAFFNKQRALKIHSVMTQELDAQEYDEPVYGVLSGIDFDKRGGTSFSLHSYDGNIYSGSVATSLHKEIRENEWSFLEKLYDFKVRVKYTPETKFSNEKYEYTLLEISDSA